MEIIGVVSPPKSENEAYAVTNARIDNIISAVTTDTEVTDIRLGANGVSYTTAGEAVRSQIADINNMIDETMYHRNLFDYDNRLQGKDLGAAGTVITASGYDVVNEEIYNRSNGTLYFSQNGTPEYIRNICEYASDGSFIQRITYVKQYTFTSGVSYIRVSLYANKSLGFQIEWDQVTEYVGYIKELKNTSIGLQCRTDHARLGTAESKITNLETNYITDHATLTTTSEIAARHDSGVEQEDYTIMLDGYFYGSRGKTFTADQMAVTNPIYVCKGDIIDVTCNGFGSNVSVITKCDSSGTYQSTLVAGTTNSNFVKTYFCTAENDMYICFSYKKADGLVINLRRKEPLWRWETVTTAIGQDEKYYKSNKTTGELSTWAITEPIKLNKGDIMRVEANGYDQYVSVISECPSNGACISVLVTGVDNSAKPYFYKAEYTEYVAISYKKSDGLKVQIKRKEYPEKIKYTSETGYYIGKYGGIVADSGTASHAYTSAIAVPAFSRVEVHARLASGGAAVALVNSDLSVHYPYMLGDETANYYVIDTYTDPIYISASYNINFPCDIYVYDKPENRGEWAEFLEKKNALKQFSRILCIGDSLTQGFLKSSYKQGNTVLEPAINLPNRSYPCHLAKDMGAAFKDFGYTLGYAQPRISYTSVNYVANAAASGTDPKQWYAFHIADFVDFSSAGSSSPIDSFTNYDAVFIFLGTNNGLADTNGTLPDTTGTPPAPESIITRDGDGKVISINIANTNGYCWIIELIKRANPNAKIFLVGIHYDLLNSSGNGTIDSTYSGDPNASPPEGIYTIDGVSVTGLGNATNIVIQKIATAYGCAFLDIYKNKYFALPYPSYHMLGSTWHSYGSDFLGSHFNVPGYRLLENIIAGLAGKYIEEHPDKYQM